MNEFSMKIRGGISNLLPFFDGERGGEVRKLTKNLRGQWSGIFILKEKIVYKYI